MRTEQIEHIKLIRYMGNKGKILKNIVPILLSLKKEGDYLIDLMAGTNAVGYALKKYMPVIANDVQEYSYVIGRAIVENTEVVVDRAKAFEELSERYMYNMYHQNYSFFTDNYADKYFSARQAQDIDSLRFAIESAPVYKKELYLTALMHAMTKCQSTPGHFAQFLPAEHRRVQMLREMDIFAIFLDKCDEFRKLVLAGANHRSFHLDACELLDRIAVSGVFYLDPPYTIEQYSRFYHILETLVKYDAPQIKYKAGYRADRYKSVFSYKDSALDGFEEIFKKVRLLNGKLVISYSDSGLVSAESIMERGRSYFSHIELLSVAHQHSTQGKGKRDVHELLFVCE